MPAAGDLIGEKYRLEGPIALGGMGTVWRAHNETLGTPIAIKLGRSEGAGLARPERLLTEAKAAANLDHPAIVRVFDFGTAPSGAPFVVMELLSGETLRDFLERERSVPAPEAIRILLPVLAGIDAAHSHGIVHRDLKPENIFLARHDGGNVQPKIVDFGIAKMTQDSPRITSKGTVIGSPEYMAPEQATGERDVDQRVDVWSAAVVLYEMIAGRTPWSGPNCPALLRAILQDDAPSLSGTHGVDASLLAILDLGLAKNREHRWKSARELGSALACWLLAHGYADDISGASLRACWPATQTSAALLPRFTRAPSRGVPRPAGHRGSSRRRRRATAGLWVLATLMAISSVLGVLAMRRAVPSEVQVERQPMLVSEPPSVVPTAEVMPEPPVVPVVPVVQDEKGIDPPQKPPARPPQSARRSSVTAVTPLPAPTEAPPPAPPSLPPPDPAAAQDMDFGF
jgi:serine/threonine-protein kinase